MQLGQMALVAWFGHAVAKIGSPCSPGFKKTPCPSPLRVKARALSKAISLAYEKEWKKIALKSDALVVVQALNARKEMLWGIKIDTQELSATFESFWAPVCWLGTMYI